MQEEKTLANLENQWPIAKVFSLELQNIHYPYIIWRPFAKLSFLPQIIQTAEFANVFHHMIHS